MVHWWGAHGRTPSLSLTVSWLTVGLWAMPLSTGVSLSPHLLSLLTSRVSLDKTSAGTPVPAGSKASTGESGRQAGDGAKGRREETKREERPKRVRDTKRGEIPTYREKQNGTEKVRDPEKETRRQERETSGKRQKETECEGRLEWVPSV